ncbi:uncharacterized protein L201_000316 [Kwoniella dendrophila CBS 6074]|uniref:Uncharacterized protein n=1 Tax=Kwoniella dendrophila CBS 6074 TaxID=1295534 RepID=A0AAX4JM30_9TREE
MSSHREKWSIRVTKEELEFLLIFKKLVPHIFSSPYDYELAVAPALGYGRVGTTHTGIVEQSHQHDVLFEDPLSPQSIIE